MSEATTETEVAIETESPGVDKAVPEGTEDIRPENDVVAGDASASGEAAQATSETILDDSAETDAADTAGAASWPEDWRERMAGENAKFLGTLKRYASPESVAKAFGSLRQKMSSGEIKAALSEDATDEQIAAWRKDNGIPEEPAGYEIPAISGFEWDDAQKAAAEPFLQRMHERNVHPGIVQEVLGWYAETALKEQETQFNTDSENRKTLEDDLRLEWGPEYRANIALLSRFLENDLPDEFGSDLAMARLPDGTRFIDNPVAARWLTQLARDVYGDGGFVSGDAAAAVAGRKEELEAMMANDTRAYWTKNADGKAPADELAEILQREEARKGSRAA